MKNYVVSFNAYFGIKTGREYLKHPTLVRSKVIQSTSKKAALVEAVNDFLESLNEQQILTFRGIGDTSIGF